MLTICGHTIYVPCSICRFATETSSTSLDVSDRRGVVNFQRLNVESATRPDWPGKGDFPVVAKGPTVAAVVFDFTIINKLNVSRQ